MEEDLKEKVKQYTRNATKTSEVKLEVAQNLLKKVDGLKDTAWAKLRSEAELKAREARL